MAESIELYRGRWEDVPIEESFMLKKSMELFGDPEPCAIHRGGVRLELLRQMNERFAFGEKPDAEEGLALLRACMDCGEITAVRFSDAL